MSRDRAPTTLIATPTSNGPRPELSLVVPAYNEAERLPALLSSLASIVQPGATEIIVVDDGSSDATVERASESGGWAPNFKLVGHGRNRGKGAAVRSGVLASSGRVVGFVDADDATDLSELDTMVSKLEGNVAAVFGSRHAPGSRVRDSPAIRGLMGRTFNHLVKISAGTAIADTQCGAKIFTGPAARLAFAVGTIEGFAFDVEVLLALLRVGFEVEEHPVSWRYVQGSKIRPLTPLRMLRDIAIVRQRRSWPKLACIDTNWSEVVAKLGEPLFNRAVLRPGDSCRLVFPATTLGDAERAKNQLRQSGLWAEVHKLDVISALAETRHST